MALHFAILEGQVTGAAPYAVGDGGIVVTFGINMATQTSAAEHVVGQGKRSSERGGNRDFPRSTQAVLCSEMAPDCVDFIFKSEMQGMGGRRYLLGMAGATGCRHSRWVARLGDKTGMGLFDLAFTVNPSVAGGAGLLVVWINFDILMTPLATDFCRGVDRRWLSSLRSLGFGKHSLLCPATAQQQQNYEERDERAIHNLDTVP
jgi:hypothetical protein